MTAANDLASRLQRELILHPGALRGPATIDSVVAAATQRFVAGERVDMGVLAGEVGVGRATLYRWFGDREHLIGRVLWLLSEQTLEWLAAQAPPTETTHVLASVETFMQVTSVFPPLRRFLAAEPAVALRALLDPDAHLLASMGAWTATRLEAAGYGAEPTGPNAAELAEVLVSVTSTYCWARVIAGGEADVAGAMRAVRVLLRAP